MSTTKWEAVLTRLTSSEPEDLDDLLRPHDPRARDPGADFFPDGVGVIPFAPEFRSADMIAIGIRLRDQPTDSAELAARLAAFGLERQVEVVALSHSDYSGLERFGIRSERISGPDETTRTACERQVAGFWNLQVII